MKRALQILLFIIIGCAALISFWPKETIDWTVHFDEAEIGDDIDAYLAAREAEVDGITPGAEKRVDWIGAPGQKAEYAIVYLHGFSATSQEIAPVPELIANDIGANVYYARLAGHGRDGQAMAEATAGAWYNDLHEALAIGRRIGERVIVVTASTGGTLASFAAIDINLARNIDGIVFISPNFGMKAPGSFLLNWPFARSFVPLLIGEERSWEPFNEEHGKWWTTSYPTQAVFPLANLVRNAVLLNFKDVFTPAFFIYMAEDEVVDAAETDRIAEAWGGAKTIWKPEPQDGMDPSNHVIAGDIMSPAMTAPVAQRISTWIKDL
jgi:esterase/lipase